MINESRQESQQAVWGPGISRVLLTGGAGYLAGFIRERLIRQVDLTLFDRLPMQAECRTLVGDITDYEDVLEACRGQDVVIHTVALTRDRFGKPAATYADVMVKGTWNLLQACVAQGGKRVVNISSIIADGPVRPNARPCTANGAPRFVPGDLFYCVSKKLGEVLGNAYAQAHPLSVIHLRPGVIDGDGANPPVIGSPAGIAQPWFVYVHPADVAQAVECALRTSIHCATYNIVAGRRDSLYDWQTAAREIGYAPQHNWPAIPEVRWSEEV